MALGSLTLEKMFQNFEVFPEWEDRFRYLIDLGRQLPPMDEALKTEVNRVHGCMSQVWFVIKPAEEGSGKIDFLASSDAHIVKGLIAVLWIACAGKTAEEIQTLDLEGVFGRLGLESQLSINRRNGFYAMVKRLRELARETAGGKK
ncbi:MAG: SufE family protein [Candidatus Omnitrophota bacterium]